MKLPNILYKALKIKALKIAKAPLPLIYPIEVDVGLTNHCNLNCSFCPNDKIKKKRGFMEESLFKSVVDCIVTEFESKAILGLGLFGEATLHPNFVDFLKYASLCNLKINISTNTVILYGEIAETILNSKINLIEISFYTLDKKRYGEVTNSEQYDQVLKNIHSFLNRAEKQKFEGNIRLRPFDVFPTEMSMYKNEFYKRYPNLNFERQEIKKMRNWAGFFNVKDLLKGIYIQRPCLSPFRRLAVDWDGEVKLCCQAMLSEDLSVGYVDNDYNLYDLWKSKELNEIRERFLKLDYSRFPSCKRCYNSRRYLRFSDVLKLVNHFRN